MSLDEGVNDWQYDAARLNFSSRILHVSGSEDKSSVLLEEVQQASDGVCLFVINLWLALDHNWDYVFLHSTIVLGPFWLKFSGF